VHPVSCDVRRGCSPEELLPGAGRLLSPSAFRLRPAEPGAAERSKRRTSGYAGRTRGFTQ